MSSSSSWEPLPQRKKRRGKTHDESNDGSINTEIAKNIQMRSERVLLPGTLEGLDGVRNEFYEC